MIQESIKLVKEGIKDCEDEQSRLGSRISSLHNQIEEAERSLFNVKNLMQSLESALKNLEEAVEKTETELKQMEEMGEKESTEEEELTPEERTKVALDDADNLIEREKKRQKQKKKGWKLCTKCNKNRVAPWNKKQICSPCQLAKKSKEKKEIEE